MSLGVERRGPGKHVEDGRKSARGTLLVCWGGDKHLLTGLGPSEAL